MLRPLVKTSGVFRGRDQVGVRMVLCLREGLTNLGDKVSVTTEGRGSDECLQGQAYLPIGGQSTLS